MHRKKKALIKDTHVVNVCTSSNDVDARIIFVRDISSTLKQDLFIIQE